MSFLSTAEIERFLTFAAPELKEIVLEARNIVCAARPGATERILWRALFYHDEAKGGPIKGGICQLEIQPRRVRLAFVHGVRLHDPEGLLHGNRLSKRHMDLKRYEDVPWDSVRRLVEDAAALDTARLGPLKSRRA
jgi:hypothetical protein